MDTLPFGSWPSPLSPASLASGQTSLDEVRTDGSDTYWLEGRPSEGGRVVLVRHEGAGGVRSDVVGPEWNVRTRVHEYGGGAYAVERGTVVFSHFADGRLRRIDGPGSEPVPFTPAEDLRYGGLVLRGAHVYAVREDHRGEGEPRNELVRLDLHGENADGGTVLWSGSDFVSRPAVDAGADRVAWVTWDHPEMPWDTTTLRSARLVDSGVADSAVVVSEPGVSVLQPAYSPTGELWFVSDSSGAWNLHRLGPDGPEQLTHGDRDLAGPPWTLGLRDFAFLDDGRVVLRTPGAARGLGLLDPATGETAPLALDGVGFAQLCGAGQEVAVWAGRESEPAAVVRGPVGGPFSVLATADESPLEPAFVAEAQRWTWTDDAGLEVHGLLYEPRHRDVTGPADERPPLLVHVHGGPTSRASAAMSPAVQFWTTRGFAVLDVDYSGSTGYGRAYRDRLRGQWGVLDIDDCTSGARSLAETGKVDGARLAISGGSAGGYTVLRALTTSKDFAAGTSYFGVADLGALARDTHKFESRYLDGLVAPYPEGAEVYDDRSPIQHIEDLQGAVLLLQGTDDLVVPRAQAEEMAAALEAAGKDVELVLYDGEGHGFRRRESIEDALTRELAFYGRVFGFTPAQP